MVNLVNEEEAGPQGFTGSQEENPVSNSKETNENEIINSCNFEFTTKCPYGYPTTRKHNVRNDAPLEHFRGEWCET